LRISDIFEIYFTIYIKIIIFNFMLSIYNTYKDFVKNRKPFLVNKTPETFKILGVKIVTLRGY